MVKLPQHELLPIDLFLARLQLILVKYLMQLATAQSPSREQAKLSLIFAFQLIKEQLQFIMAAIRPTQLEHH